MKTTRQKIIELALDLGLESYAEWMMNARYHEANFAARLRALRHIQAAGRI